MFNWWPLMWKKTHREKMKFCESTTSPTLTGWANIAMQSNPILDDMQAAQDCDAVMKAAKVRIVNAALKRIGKKPRSGKRITTASKKRRR